MKIRFWMGMSSLFLAMLLFGVASGPAWGDSPAQSTASPITIEALSPDANVRSTPTIAENIVGQIQPGELYPALGRYFEWVLIEYPPAANQRAWVFNGVVRLNGATIDTLPTIDPASIPAALPTATQPVLATAPNMTVIPGTTLPPTTQASPVSGGLPTFTPVAITPTSVVFSELESTFETVPADEINRRLDAIKQVYNQPIMLVNGTDVILLDPASVGFAINEEAMRAEINPSLRFFIAQTIITADYSPELLTAYVNDLAARYSTPATAIFDPTNLTFQLGTPGQILDTVTLQERLQVALFSPYPIGRTVTLPLVTEPRLDMNVLREAILTYFSRYGVFYDGLDSVISVYVEDLATGQTMGILPNVLHSATSTAKIGVIANVFRYLYQSPSQDIVYRMMAAIICSSNADANILMATTGNGDDLAGLRLTTDTYCRAGATHTRVDRHFFIGPAGEGAVAANYYDLAGAPVCPANTALDPAPAFPVDEGIQTTAADMGGFLSDIYACANNAGGLVETFPGEITPDECSAMLEILSGTNFAHMIELGVPSTMQISHKVGYAGQAAGDAGIVYSPGGDYVITIYIWDERLGNFDSYALSRWAIMGEISRITYNFFNPDAPLLAPQSPLNSNGGAACVLPSGPENALLSDVNAGRFDENGIPLPTACYDWPTCRPFDNWGQN